MNDTSEHDIHNSKPALHIVRVDIDAERETAFNEWYNTVHIPELLACPGWLSARRFVCEDGGPRYVAVYEVAGLWAYETEAFKAVKGFAEFQGHIRNFRRQVFLPISGSAGAVFDSWNASSKIQI